MFICNGLRSQNVRSCVSSPFVVNRVAVGKFICKLLAAIRLQPSNIRLGGFFTPSALGVELEEAGQDVLIGDVFFRNYGPAVGGEDGLVEFAVGVLEPGGIFVVEVGEGALFQFGGRGIGRIEPSVAFPDEVAGGGGDGFDSRVVFGFFARRPGEGEGFEGAFWGIAKAASFSRSCVPRAQAHTS